MGKNHNRSAAMSAAVVIIFFCLSGSAFSLSFDPLPPVEGLSGVPGQLAVSTQGDFFVTDGGNNRIAVYDRSGTFLRYIPITRPSALAVNSGGILYVGAKEDLSVRMYDENGSATGRYLGRGEGEFRLPIDMDIDDQGGDVFVVDSLARSVRIYTGQGEFIRSIEGQLDNPLSVTVFNGEVYVVDRPIMTGGRGEPYNGAEVAVFSLSGERLRNFGAYGMGPGEFISPSDIAHDGDGRIYVTDGYQGVVLCYDGPTGQYLGAIHTPQNPMVTPTSLEVTGEDILAVVSQNTYSIHRFGLSGYTNMQVSPNELVFVAKKGMNPSPQDVTVSNLGNGELVYSASADAGWIILPNEPGIVYGGNSSVIPVNLDVEGLEAGTYSGNLFITGSSGVAVRVAVRLEVKESPKITVSPSGLAYTYRIGGDMPDEQLLVVEVTGDPNGEIEWTAGPDSGWIAVSPAAGSGQGSTEVRVAVNPTGLREGIYTAVVTVLAEGASGSPASVNMTLAVKASGSIHVTTNLDEARFGISGPVTERGGGKDWTVNNVPDGTYTVGFEDVKGYRTPAPMTQSVVNGGVIEFSADYERIVPERIIVSGDGKTKGPNVISILDADGNVLHAFEALPDMRGGVNTAVGDVDGDGQNEIIVGHNRAPFMGIYDGSGNEKARTRVCRSGGVFVKTADIDGNGDREIVAIDDKGDLHVLDYTDGKLVLVSPNIENRFMKNRKAGDWRFAAADTDGDGSEEIVVSLGVGNRNVLMILEIVNTEGFYFAEQVDEIELPLAETSGIAGHDLKGNSRDQILAAGEEGTVAVDAVDRRIEHLADFPLLAGVLGVGDVDGDGDAELVVGFEGGLVFVYDMDGTYVSGFEALQSGEGVNLSLGIMLY